MSKKKHLKMEIGRLNTEIHQLRDKERGTVLYAE